MMPGKNLRTVLTLLKTCTFLHALAILLPLPVPAQSIVKKALFLGNSYTYVNNLPLLTAALANAAGDSLFFDTNTPGGYTLGWHPIAHATSPVSLGKIQANDWDFVILQEQSQTPVISRLRDSCMYPAAVILHDSVKSSHPCGRILFYLTWGRRFGGVQCFAPNYCSANFIGFSQMQDSLTWAIKKIADSLSDWIAPVGEAWRLVIGNTAMVLHDADNSHPNLNGSYLAACVFYSAMFGTHAEGNTFTAGLSPDSALLLQRASDSIVFGYYSQWNLNNDAPHAAFNLAVSTDTVFTQNLSTGAGHWLWDFGDGQTSQQFEPYHVYAGNGTWTVKLRACSDCRCDSTARDVNVTTTGTTSSQDNVQPIGLTGPDQNGRITFRGFRGDGILVIADLTGKTRLVLPVTDGVAHAAPLSQGLWIWVLGNAGNEVLSRGKLISKNPLRR